MNIRGKIYFQWNVQGLTFVEMMVSIAAGSLILAAVAALGISSSRAFVVLDNHSRLDSQNRLALDIIGRELRRATAVIQWQTNEETKTLWLTNATEGASTKFVWLAKDRSLVMNTGQDSPKGLLAGCDHWDFTFYGGVPGVSSEEVGWIPATNAVGAMDLSVCRAIGMTWGCSREFRNLQVNSETIQCAPVVLRNLGR
jgi:type II secretory pathway component PulJ